MIIRSKDKVQMGGKNKPVWVLDTDALTVTHNTPDAEPSKIAFSSDHIKYHLHYSRLCHLISRQGNKKVKKTAKNWKKLLTSVEKCDIIHVEL